MPRRAALRCAAPCCCASQDEKLKQLVATYGENEVDWEAVALQLVQRSEWQCRDRWNRALDPSRIKGPWTPEVRGRCGARPDVAHRLRRRASGLALAPAAVARARRAEPRRHRRELTSEAVALHRPRRSLARAQEDATITRLVAEFGPTKWSRIAAHLPGRLNKQCRERWHNQLDPSIRKESFTAEEDETLINAHRQMGNRWAEIARLLPGRTDNAVKNHWNNSVRRRLQRQMAENPNIGPVHPDHLAALQQPIRKKRSAAGKRARAAAEAAAAAAAAGGELVGVASGPKSTDVSGSVGARSRARARRLARSHGKRARALPGSAAHARRPRPRLPPARRAAQAPRTTSTTTTERTSRARGTRRRRGAATRARTTRLSRSAASARRRSAGRPRRTS